MLAVAPDSVEDLRKYLAKFDVEIPDIRQTALAKVAIRGTPTLVFINRRGIVERVWRGFLGPEGERDVMAFLSGVAR